MSKKIPSTFNSEEKAQLNAAADWKNVDLRKNLAVDLDAAISCLRLIRDKPEIFETVLNAVENMRQEMIAAEAKKPKNQPDNIHGK